MADVLKVMDEDDDFIVDIEEGADDESIFDNQDDDAAPEAEKDPLVASTLPDDGDDDEDDGGASFVDDMDDEPTSKRAAADDADDDFDEEEVVVDASTQNDFQAQEHQQRINQAEARSVMVEAQSRARVAQADAAQAQLGLETVNQRRGSMQQQLQDAYDNEDLGTASQIQTQMRALDNLEGQLHQAVSQLENPDAIIHQGNQVAQQIMHRQAPGKSVGVGISTSNPVAARWAKANQSWMSTDKAATDFVKREAQQMVNSGQWDASQPGFYAELSRRTKANRPDLAVKAISAKQQKGRARVRSTVAPGRSRSAAPARQSSGTQRNANRITLGKGDLAAMRRSNLDPENSKHRKYFAKSRIDTKRSERMG